MSENRIDLDVTQEQVDTILAALKTVEETIPGLIELTPDQRKGMARYSDKDLGFILKALSIAEQHPEILPPSFKLDEMRRDVDALQKLSTLFQALTRVTGIVGDSRYAAATESQGHGRSIYQFVKTHNNLTGERKTPSPTSASTSPAASPPNQTSL
ncbi:hypothetical protein MTYM_00076 [Methylococcales bacterium]|nr:hypothetical protein MTYM_00076 [Methylococcales bacterium]